MQKQILLIITGSIAAYKALDLIRNLKKEGHNVSTILTKGAKEFVTELSVAALSESEVYSEIFSLKDETQMGHIKLSRESDLILVAPASADFIAKAANGFADDLASTVLLATNKPVFIAPAMNVMMWQHKAVQRNIETLKNDGIKIIEPSSGQMACNEVGQGRLAEIEDIMTAIL